jgi:hypothetical protein
VGDDAKVFVARLGDGRVRLIVRKACDGEGALLTPEQFAFFGRMGFPSEPGPPPPGAEEPVVIEPETYASALAHLSECHAALPPWHGPPNPSLLDRVKAAAARLETHEADLAEASGALMLPLPEPGSVEAKLLRANGILRRERDTLRDLTRKLGFPFADYDKPREDDGVVPRDACEARIDRLLGYESEGVADANALRAALADINRAIRDLEALADGGTVHTRQARKRLGHAATSIGYALARAERRAERYTESAAAESEVAEVPPAVGVASLAADLAALTERVVDLEQKAKEPRT